MIIIKRKIEFEKSGTSESGNVQASINSNGQITLRTHYEPEKDEIVILSERETQAIFTLFKQIKALGTQLPEMPF